MDYQFSNLLGAPYRGGNLVIHGTELLSPVGNRVSQIDLAQSTSQTLPFENLKQVSRLVLSPNGQLLLSIDVEGRALLVVRPRRVLLHHFTFKAPVGAAAFSPDGKYLAVGVGKLLQVWVTPALDKQLAPMQLHRSYGGCHDTITCLDWSPDGQLMAVGSADLTLRVFSLHPIPGYTPPVLTGHREAPRGVWFASAAMTAASVTSGAPECHLWSVSNDGGVLGWSHKPAAQKQQQQQQAGTVNGMEHSKAAAAGGQRKDGSSSSSDQQPAPPLSLGTWSLAARHHSGQRSSKVTAAALHTPSGVLVLGYSTGLMELYQLPDWKQLQVLSVSRDKVSALTFNAGGDWLALGCASLGQLLVWEWRSEAYVLKQQGHYYDVSCVAYSPDGALVATGAADAKVKLFQLSSGFCYVTFSDHTAPVTAVTFLPAGHAVLSASLDGSVRAHDLLRYRCFRTLTTPEAVQFGSLAVDPSGEVVVAGGLDTFQIYVWFLKTGRLLEVVAGHTGPVAALAFSPTEPLLASASWDKTVRLWDVYDGKGCQEVLEHSHDVLALAYRPDGKQLASATLDGSIYLWSPQEGACTGVIEGRRDVAGGRLANDRRSAGNAASGATFTSLVYSADGGLLFASGASKWVCVYDVAEQVLLRRFQITANRSLDGVLDTLNSRHLTDAGPLQLIDDAPEDPEVLPPGGNPAAAADVPGAPRKRPVARTAALALAPTGQSWAAATTEGLLVYSLRKGALFDPTDLTEDLTPAAFHTALANRAYARALLIALRLGDTDLLRKGLMAVPQQQIALVAPVLPAVWLEALLRGCVAAMQDTPHLEFVLLWVSALLLAHGTAAQELQGGALGPVLRLLQQALSGVATDLKGVAEDNVYMLDYIVTAAAADKQRRQQQEQQQQLSLQLQEQEAV